MQEEYIFASLPRTVLSGESYPEEKAEKIVLDIISKCARTKNERNYNLICYSGHPASEQSIKMLQSEPLEILFSIDYDSDDILDLFLFDYKTDDGYVDSEHNVILLSIKNNIGSFPVEAEEMYSLLYRPPDCEVERTFYNQGLYESRSSRVYKFGETYTKALACKLLNLINLANL